MRAINDNSAIRGRGPLVNENEKNVKDANKADSEKSIISSMTEAEDEISITQNGANNTRTQSVDSKLSLVENPISDESVLKKVFESVRNGILSNPSTALQVHKSITPDSVLQLIEA